MHHNNTSPLLFALKDGRIVHVDEVENGKSCGCTCPVCGETLVARNGGKKMMSHFAHDGDSSCANAIETMLHLLAKDVLSECRELMLPSYDEYSGGAVNFEEVQVERKRDGLQPDCIGKIGNHELWIEFRVTHEVDDVKREYVISHRQGCIEIDLSRFYRQRFTREELLQFLIEEQADRQWIYIRGYYEARLRIEAEAKVKVSQQVEALLACHPGSRLLEAQLCSKCRWHSTRLAVARLIHPFLWRRNNLADAILALPLSRLKRPLVQKSTPPTAKLVCGDYHMTIRNIYDNEHDRQMYYTFRALVPELVRSYGHACDHLLFSTNNGHIICTCADMRRE